MDIPQSQPIRWKGILFPIEHGAWGFLFEPIVLGMLAAPSGVGALLSLGTIAAFMIRHPLKILIKAGVGARRGRAALVVTAAYAAVGGCAFIIAARSAGLLPLVPFLVLSPFMLVFWLLDAQRKGRALVAELVGPMGLAAVGPAITLAAGWDPLLAGGVWWMLMARTVPSILYVRARLRLERGEVVDRANVIGYHVAFLGVAAVLVTIDRVPVLSILALSVLLGRAAIGLSRWRRPAVARQVGFAEIGHGLFYAIVVAIGYRFGV